MLSHKASVQRMVPVARVYCSLKNVNPVRSAGLFSLFLLLSFFSALLSIFSALTLPDTAKAQKWGQPQWTKSPRKVIKRHQMRPRHLQQRHVTQRRVRIRRRKQQSLLGSLFGIDDQKSPRAVARMIERYEAHERVRAASLSRARHLRDRPFSAPRSGNWGAGRYRTMCVRTCDGYYFPLSFRARGSQMRRDAARCESACPGAESKLFYYPNADESDVGGMRALDGRRYESLTNAFRYRKEVVANCRCKPQSWSEEARTRHERYAQAERRAGHRAGARTGLGVEQSANEDANKRRPGRFGKKQSFLSPSLFPASRAPLNPVSLSYD